MRAFKILGVSLTALALSTVVTFAHMALSKSAPEADATVSGSPDQIQIWFTQDPDPAVSRITLEGPGGDVALGEVEIHDDRSVAAALDGALDPGEYTVSWRSAGDDGHVQRGSFSFTVRAD